MHHFFSLTLNIYLATLCLYLGRQDDQTHTFIFYTQKVDLCDCNQKKISHVREFRIKDASVAVHFCKFGIPKSEIDTGQTCLDQCSKYCLELIWILLCYSCFLTGVWICSKKVAFNGSCIKYATSPSNLELLRIIFL